MSNAKKGTVFVDFSTPCGHIKPLNATNNGPLRCGTYHALSNFEDYRAARIPYARTHDSALGEAWGPHAVDISAVFPHFDADVSDPACYDFAVTDDYLANIRAAGTGIYYRLGQSIENNPAKKYDIFPPRDYRKWAAICEHIIRHYTEGWADGYHDTDLICTSGKHRNSAPPGAAPPNSFLTFSRSLPSTSNPASPTKKSAARRWPAI